MESGAWCPLAKPVGGLILTVATGVYMKLRYGARFRESSWFITEPVARAGCDLPAGTRRRLLSQIVSEWLGVVLLAIGLSYLSGFWLTYVDIGIWALAIGAIKVGPATAAVDRSEATGGHCYRVSARRLRGTVQLSSEAQPSRRSSKPPTTSAHRSGSVLVDEVIGAPDIYAHGLGRARPRWISA